MMYFRPPYCFLLLVAIFPWGNLMAQEDTDRPLLADVELQKVFIDASKEKMLERYQDAAYLYKEVLKKDPNNSAAAYELARMYDVLEKDKLALQAIERALRNDPSNVWYRDFHAQVLERNQKMEEAAGVYAELARDYPDNEYFLFQQAYYLIKANQPEKAVVVYDKLEKMMGVNEELAKKKYTLYYKMGDHKAAVAEMDRLIKEFPKELRYLHILADFHTQEGNAKAAQKIYQRILTLAPQDPEAQMALAASKKNGGDHLGYLSSIRDVISQANVNIDMKVKELLPYITMLGESDDAEFKMQALQLGELLTQTHPEEAKAHSLYADMLYHAGQSDAALKSYETTLQLDKSVFAVWEQVMYIHLEKGDMQKLAGLSEEAMDYFPNQARVYYMNGIAQAEMGKQADAASMFEQALMMSGKNQILKQDIYIRLGVTYAEMAKHSRSDEMFDKALEINPDSYQALYHYSYQLAKRGESLQKARGMAFKAHQIKPGLTAQLANLGRIHFLLKNYEESLKWLEQALESGGKNASLHEAYGDTLFKLGKPNQAAIQWTKAKELGGNALELDKKINGGL